LQHFGERDRNKFLPAKDERPSGIPCEISKSMMHRIGLAVKLQCTVIGQDCILCEMSCQQVGIDRVILGGESPGNDGIQATSEPQQVPCLDVIGKQRLPRLRPVRAG